MRGVCFHTGIRGSERKGRWGYYYTIRAEDDVEIVEDMLLSLYTRCRYGNSAASARQKIGELTSGGRGVRETIQRLVNESLMVKEQFFSENIETLLDIIKLITKALRRRNKILIFGNGGSAADAQHIAAEFVNRYLLDRPPLPAIALTTDSSVLTSISNDVDFAQVFVRQIEALGKKGDIAWGITTSGESRNVLMGLRKAHEMGMATIAFTGRDGGEAQKICDHGLQVAAPSTPRIQEAHITAAHIICEVVERKLFNVGGSGEK